MHMTTYSPEPVLAEPPRLVDEHYIDPHQAAEILGVRYQTLAKWRMDGRGPKWLKLNPRVVRYKLSSVLEWLDSCSGQQ